MAELTEKLEKVKTDVKAVQAAPLWEKAARAEQALINACYLLECLVSEMERIKDGK